jgi:deoxyadenosine/deoxycytidine kinase
MTSAAVQILPPPPLRHVVVEGVIGVGKTSLVEGLGRLLDARTVLESFADNPFLAAFYADPERHAFATEMFFLVHRFAQQESLLQGDLLHRVLVSDYLFEKCRLFAGVTLREHELRLFDRVWDLLQRQVPRPDLVIYLHAPVSVVQARIGARGRSFEQTIEPAYLHDLDRQYRALLATWPADQVAWVDTTDLDLRQPAQVAALWERIAAGHRGALDAADLVR